jgi:hypothetical protein
MSHPEGEHPARPTYDPTIRAIYAVARTMGDYVSDDVPTQYRLNMANENRIEVDAATPVQPGEVADYLRALSTFNARREGIDDGIRAGREQAYAALLLLMQQQQDRIRPDMSMAELAAFLEQEVLNSNFATTLSPDGYDHLYETFDLLQEYASDPEEIRLMVEIERRQQDGDSESAAQPVGGASNDVPLERAEVDTREQLAGRVLTSARDNAVINTSAPYQLPVRMKGGQEGRTHGGQNTFGPGGRELPSHLLRQPGPYNTVYSGDPEAREYPKDIVEAVSFTPATDPINKTVTTRQGGGLFRRGQEINQQEKVGERPRTIVNPATGQEEPAVYFDYTYNPGLADPEVVRRLHLPVYRECDGSRPGNSLAVRTILPQSVAREIETAIRQDPTYARQLAEQIVLDAGGVSEDAWERGVPRKGLGGALTNRMKPPYEGLPADHQVFILEPTRTSSGRDVYIASPL